MTVLPKQHSGIVVDLHCPLAQVKIWWNFQVIRFPVLVFLLLGTAGPLDANAQTSPTRYKILAQPIQQIPPGTCVDDGPPRGWSHLIIKSAPRCTQGDLAQVPHRDQRLASCFKNIFLANIRSSADRVAPFYISNIAVGTAISVDGTDTVVNCESLQDLGVALSIAQKVLLREIEKRHQQIKIVVLGRQFAIVDIPTVVRYDEANESMVLRYALLAESTTGQLTSLLWLLRRADADSFQLVSAIHVLSPSHLEQTQLYVDQQHYRLGIPTERAFAVTGLPQPLRTVVPPRWLAEFMQKVSFTESECSTLDIGLRNLCPVDD